MMPILWTGFGLVCLVAVVWAVGVSLQGQVFDHEEVRRINDEWEEME